MLNGVAGVDSGRFTNGTLGSSNPDCAIITDLWVLVFGVSHVTSASAGDMVAFSESLGGVKIANGS